MAYWHIFALKIVFHVVLWYNNGDNAISAMKAFVFITLLKIMKNETIQSDKKTFSAFAQRASKKKLRKFIMGKCKK